MASSDPQAMLLQCTVGPSLQSDRKLRLFATTCCRQVWHLLTDPRSRNAVEVAERYADGEATELKFAYALDLASGHSPHNLVRNAFPHDAASGVGNTLHWLSELSVSPSTLANLLRDIVGNPFRPVTLGDYDHPNDPIGVRIAPHWLTPTVLSVAAAAYDERDRPCLACNRWTDCRWCKNTRRLPKEDGSLDPLRLAILADALEEAGCQEQASGKWGRCHGCGELFACIHKYSGCGSADCDGEDYSPVVKWQTHQIVAHLRGPGPHVRGCWAADLLLGKE